MDTDIVYLKTDNIQKEIAGDLVTRFDTEKSTAKTKELEK